MTIVMSDVFAPIKREASFFLSYSSSRPRFKLHLVIDAILSVALTLAAFQIATAPSRHNAMDQLKLSGAVAFSGSELVKFVREENLVAYWAGLNSAYKYTLIATTPGEVTISYFPKNADIGKLDTSKLVIKTDNNLLVDEAQAYADDVSGSGAFLINQGSEGNAVYYNPTTPNEVTVSFKKQFAAVTIFDSVLGTPLALAMKPGVIQKIS